MSATQWSRISKVHDELSRCNNIPSAYLSTLEERLLIAFHNFRRQERLKTPRASKDVRSQHTQKKANRVYLSVLDFNPHLLIPFMLAISPKSCETFNFSNGQAEQANLPNIHFGDGTKQTLQETAQRHNFEQHPFYRKLVDAIFETGQSEN